MKNTIEKSDAVTKEIKEQAIVYAIDNFHLPTEKEILIIESAMFIGASIALRKELEYEKMETEKMARR